MVEFHESCVVCGVPIERPLRKYCKECSKKHIKKCRNCKKLFSGWKILCQTCWDDEDVRAKFDKEVRQKKRNRAKRQWKENYEEMLGYARDGLNQFRAEHPEFYTENGRKAITEYRERMYPIWAARRKEKEEARLRRIKYLQEMRKTVQERRRIYFKWWHYNRRMSRPYSACEHCGTPHQRKSPYCSIGCHQKSVGVSEETKAKIRLRMTEYARNHLQSAPPAFDVYRNNQKRSETSPPVYMPTVDDYAISIPSVMDRHDLEDRFEGWDLGSDW